MKNNNLQEAINESITTNMNSIFTQNKIDLVEASYNGKIYQINNKKLVEVDINDR